MVKWTLMPTSLAVQQSWSTARARPDGNFIDHVLVRVRGGRGGDGVPAFARSARNPKGRPCGGDGGRGGNVLFVVDSSLDSLNHLPSQVQAERGYSGGKNMRHGANGADLVLRLPPGCEIGELTKAREGGGELMIPAPTSAMREQEYQLEDDTSDLLEFVLAPDEEGEALSPRPSSAQTEKHQVEARFQEELPRLALEWNTSSPVLVAQGGRGGRGNHAYGQNNHECEQGQPGEERLLEVNLKTMADVGLVGLPNAGKSSFLAAVTRAHPRIASYPFTTLNPYVGSIDYGEAIGRITVADIPGLIEGAHANRGLGHQFLKHVEKARLLALVVDYAQREAPWKDVHMLLRELDLYQDGLSTKVRLIIANKADLLSPDELVQRVKDTQRHLSRDTDILPISAKYGLALAKVTERLLQLVEASGGAGRQVVGR